MPLLRNNALVNNPILREQPTTPDTWNTFIRVLNQQTVTPTAISGNIESVGTLPTLPNANYPIGSVVFYTVDGKLYRNVSDAWTKAIDGADITANTVTANALTSGTINTADIQIGTNGKFRSGQTAYDTGTGWYLDYNAGTPRFSIGNSSGNKVTWDGTSLRIVGNLVGSSETGTDSGTLSGLTTSVSVTWNYLRTGGTVTLTTTGGAGTSNTTGLQYSTLASSLRPSVNQTVAVYGTLDNNILSISSATVTTAGNITFNYGTTATTYSAFGTKGVVNGTTIIYSL